MNDDNLRSLFKSISWRITGTFDTFLISFVISGKIKIALAIGGTEFVTKIFLYYFHERAWEKINWGKGSNKIREIPVKENLIRVK